MNCYFTCQKLAKFFKTYFTTTKETALAPFNLAHPVTGRYNQILVKHREIYVPHLTPSEFRKIV